MLRIISLGAGVQSTTMALMAAHGEIGPMPDCAIFADTQDEPDGVYKHLQWLTGSSILPFPIHTITNGKLSERLFAGDDEARIPAYFEDGGLPHRQCTRNYKIRPVRRKAKELARAAGHKNIEMWIGISTDEAMRVKPSDVKFVQHRWPLIERGISRSDCLRWLERHNYPTPPKSSCVFCPYKGDLQWRAMQDDSEGWALAVSVDERLREQAVRFGGKMYLHRSRKPLSQVDFSTPEDHGQLNMFINECEGMCGV